jgi:hypothetical protein
LTKDKTISLLSDVLEPFYKRVSDDNKVANFISDEELLFKLKIRQATFTIKFLTSDIAIIKNDLEKIVTSHQKIALKIDNFLPYFFLWADVLFKWIISNFNFSNEELSLWKLKILKIYSCLSLKHLYDTPDILPINTEIQKSDTKLEIINLANMENMHKIDEEKISAKDFLSRVDIDIYFLDELKELNTDLINTINEHEEVGMEIIASITIVIFKYAKLLGGFIEFKELSFALNSLVNLLEKQKVENLDTSIQKKLIRFLDAIIEDLANWQNVIFYTQATNDIHYLDASIFSSCAQLEMTLSDSTSEHNDDLDLF